MVNWKPLLALFIFAIIMLPIHVEGKQVCQKTTLYSFTFPPQKEHATILCHPVGQELRDANNANIAFNSGVMAAHGSTVVKCPNHNNKNFCSGWDFVRRFG